MNNFGTTENTYPTEVTEPLLRTRSNLTSDINIPLQVPTKAQRINFDIHNDPKTSEKSTAQNAATLPLAQFNRAQSKIPMYFAFTQKINKLQKNPAVTHQPERPNDRQFMLKVITTTVLTLSRPSIAPLNIADFYSVSSTNDNAFQTLYNPISETNPSQTIYQPHNAPNIGPPATLL